MNDTPSDFGFFDTLLLLACAAGGALFGFGVRLFLLGIGADEARANEFNKISSYKDFVDLIFN
jgi:hypothetical protein